MCLGMANGGKQRVTEDGKKIEKLANMLEESFERALAEEMQEDANNEIYPSLENITLEQAYEDYAKASEEMKDTLLDEIDKLHKQIEYLQGEREVLLEDIQFSSNQVIEQQAEIEKLTINMNAFGLGMKREKERADTIRADAIKEFVERLKIAFIDTPMDYYEIEKTMMSIVKEMVGDDNV